MSDRFLSAHSERLKPYHGSDPSRRTFWPGCRACTPAVTMTSPVVSPPDTATLAGSKRNTSTFRIETVLLEGSTIQTAGWLLIFVSAVAGISMTGTQSPSMRPVTVAPSRIARGGSFKPTLTAKVRVTGSA